MRHSRRPTVDSFDFGNSPQRMFANPPPTQPFPFPPGGPVRGYPPNNRYYQQTPTPMIPPPQPQQQPMLSPTFFPPQPGPGPQMPPSSIPMGTPFGMPPSVPPSIGRTPMPVHPNMPPPNGWPRPPPSHHRRHHRRRQDSDDDESEEAIIPRLHPASAASGPPPGSNPLPQPPRVIPAPAVNPEGSILVDSPPAPRERPKPPPNPLPAPPKQVNATSQISPELEAANEEVKRARERTELAKTKAVARAEAEAWRAAGIPIAGDEETPVVPLIPGVTAPGALPAQNTKKELPAAPAPAPASAPAPAPAPVVTEMKDEGNGHNPLSSLLKRMSTRRQTTTSMAEPPPVAPKPPKRRSKPPPPMPPPMPTHNSGDMPDDEGIVPRSSKRTTKGPYISRIGPVVNGQQFVFPYSHQDQDNILFHPERGEYFDKTNGTWWNPETRQYYHGDASAIPPISKKGDKDKKHNSGLIATIRRWTSHTAPDHQPKPITTQYVLPRERGDTEGLKGAKALGPVPPLRPMTAKDPRGSHQPMPPSLYRPRHGPRRRTVSASGATGRAWDFPNANNAFDASRSPQANIYFSRIQDHYGAFRLDSPHSVSWAGISARSALNWYESGRFERPRMGLGAPGLDTGSTYPSHMPWPQRPGGSGGRFFKGLLGKEDEATKKAKQEYSMARTEESEVVLRLQDWRDINRAVAEFKMSGRERADWPQVWRFKVRDSFPLRLSLCSCIHGDPYSWTRFSISSSNSTKSS